MIGYGTTGVTHDFFCYNSSGQVWNGSAFANWSAGSFASYRVTATELSSSGRFTSTAPAGTVSWELRVRAATLAGSYVVFEGNENAATAATQATTAATNTTVDADGYDIEEALKLLLAVNVGKVTATATSAVFRDAADTKARVTATTTADGSRTAITLDAS